MNERVSHRSNTRTSPLTEQTEADACISTTRVLIAQLVVELAALFHKMSGKVSSQIIFYDYHTCMNLHQSNGHRRAFMPN